MSESSESPPPTSFSSLPDDVILNCLSRISRFHYPTLSLVSKGFQSLIASPELEATRSCFGKTEEYLCVCLKQNNNNPNPNPCWFIVSPDPKHKLKPLPSFPYQHPQCSTIGSIGSEIYMIGGFVRRKRSKRVFILDCRSLQWRTLPKMRLRRASPTVKVIDGKIGVIGGSRSKNIKNFGEVYEPLTRTWKLLLPAVQNSKAMHLMNGSKHFLNTTIFFVEIEKVLCQIRVLDGSLFWRDLKEGSPWVRVNGLEELSSYYLLSIANSCIRGRVTVWKKSGTIILESRDLTEERYETHIWCAEISFNRRGLRELWGLVEWSREVLTVDGWDSTPDFVLHSAIVTY